MADTGLFGLGYDHIDDAAAAALLAATFQPRASEQEYMTLLVRDPRTNKIRREAFQTDGSRQSSSWTGHPQGKMEGIVHTHPTPRQGSKYPSHFFSHTDINTARKTGLPSYIAASQVRGPASDRKYVPDQKTQAVKPIEGSQFLAQYPIEELKMQIAKRIQHSQMAPELKARLLKSLLVPQ